MRYLEDVAVGTVERFGCYEVTRDEVIAFAERYDPQPFHLSDEAAMKTHFGRLAASGWHSCAMSMAMLVGHMTASGQTSLGSPGLDELRWIRPVYPGDTLRCETEVLDTRRSSSRPEMGIVKTRLTMFNQHDIAVMTYISNAIIATRPV